MKKFVSLISVLLISAMCCISAFAEPATTNFVDDVNSTFEGVTNVTDTDWFRLTYAGGGDTKNIEIKTDGGHTGTNYISAKIEKSWYSPSINLFPFIKAAAEKEGYDTSFRIAFYARSSKNDIKSKKAFLVRGRESDVMDSNDSFNIVEKNDGNYYATVSITVSDADKNGWVYVVSDAIEIEADYLKESDHCWWFCFDTLSEGSVLDFDDFAIIPDSEYEEPEEPVEIEPKTEISYLTEEAVSNAFPAAEKETIADNTPTLDSSQNPQTNGGLVDSNKSDSASNGNSSDNYLALYIAVPVVALLIGGAAAFVVVSKLNKKNG